MNRAALEPQSRAELIGAAWRLYAPHARPLALLAARVVFPLQVASALVLLFLLPDALTSEDGGLRAARNLTEAAGQGGLIALTTLMFTLTTAICLRPLLQLRLGDEPDFAAGARWGLASAPKLAALGLLFAIGVICGLVLFIVPAIWLAVSWSVAVPALLLERKGVTAAFGRSASLVAGRWWATAGALVSGPLLALIVAEVVQAVIVAAIVIVAGDAPGVIATAQAVGGTLGISFATPFAAAVVALLHIDARLRKEHVDEVRLRRELGLEAGAAVEAPPEPFPPTSGYGAPSGALWGPPAAPGRPPGPERDEVPAPAHAGAEPAGGQEPPRPPSAPAGWLPPEHARARPADRDG